jgi:hypothetical protein
LNDPRKEATWKQKRYEDRVLLLLGAILDASLPAVVTTPEPPPVRPTRTRKQNA